MRWVFITEIWYQSPVWTKLKLAVDGGTSEPVSPVRFPENRENTGYFPESVPNLMELAPESRSFLPFLRAIP